MEQAHKFEVGLGIWNKARSWGKERFEFQFERRVAPPKYTTGLRLAALVEPLAPEEATHTAGTQQPDIGVSSKETRQ